MCNIWFFQDKLIDVRIFIFEEYLYEYHEKISFNTHAVYLPRHGTSSWKPVFFNSISDINVLIEKLWEQLPNPRELTDNDFDVSIVLLAFL